MLFDTWNRIVKMQLQLIEVKLADDPRLFKDIWNEIVRLRRQIIPLLYTSDFLPALEPFTYLLVAVFLLTFSKILTIDLSGRNRRFPCTVAMLIAMVVNIGLNILWIPKHGMLGAAWSSAISYGVQSAAMILFFLRITGVPFRKLIIPERKDIEIYRGILRRLREQVHRR